MKNDTSTQYANKHLPHLTLVTNNVADHNNSEKTQHSQDSATDTHHFQLIAETMPLPVLMLCSNTGVVLYANQHAVRLFHCAKDDELNDLVFERLYCNPAERQRVNELLTQNNGFASDCEVEFRRLNNTTFWASLSSQSVVYNEQHITLTTLSDITERKLAEEERTRFAYELFHLNKSYKRFVPQEFLSYINRDIAEVQLGDMVEREMSVLFSDIRGFTRLSEKMSPEEVFDFINIYLGQMEPVVAKHRGFVDKYNGDEIMALFPGCVDDAIQGAIAMLKSLIAYNELLKEAHYPSIQIGIGLHTGNLLLGTVGGQNHMDGTVISDAVHIASQAEDLTRFYSAPLLITDETYQKLEDPSRYHIRFIDYLSIQNTDIKTILYEVFDTESTAVFELKQKTLVDFETACHAFHNNEIKKSREYFDKVLAINPQDKAAHIYIDRCHELERAEREKIANELYHVNKAYERFIPPEFIKLLHKQSITEVSLGDYAECEMTILLADIYGLTQLSGRQTPQESFDIINAYLGKMEPLVGKYHGFINKYIGNTIMALFPRSANDALDCAISMCEKLTEHNEMLQEAGYQPIQIGIGLDTDMMMIGTVGSLNRMDGTVLADAVSFATRVEELTQTYLTNLLLTENTYQKLDDKERYHIRFIDILANKNDKKQEFSNIYEAYDSNDEEQVILKTETCAEFEQACHLYQKKEFTQALNMFNNVLAINPRDKTTQAYCDKCQTPEQVAREKFTKELSELSRAYERFMPREVLKLLNKQSVVDVQLGDHVEKEMTVLFSDIRGFTSMSEKMEPEVIFDFINIYLKEMEPNIVDNNGFVDKYIGDAIMALFPTNADDAVRGSISMLKTLVTHNMVLLEAGFEQIQIGIGLNTGPLMLGTVGGPNRMDGTVIADAVNLASRVEGLTKVYGTALLITEHTYQKLEDVSKYKIRVIDRVKVKGKSEAVTVYEVFDGDAADIIVLKEQTLADFEEGCVSYHGQQIERAREFFEKVLSINEQDEAARVYLERCLKVQRGELHPFSSLV